MANEFPAMNLKAIGIVRNEIKEPSHRDCKKVISDVVIDSSLADALDGLEEFSHIIVLYWMHKARASRSSAKIHPKGKKDFPLMGFFATRSPNRPNPLGKTTVRLLQRQGNILRVEGLDAIDGTPVIDIKPFIPGSDLPVNAKAPKWTTSR
jgi:tRNA-Thr(GGU) m(6)t(6)A37 methyltransferase TsaA